MSQRRYQQQVPRRHDQPNKDDPIIHNLINSSVLLTAASFHIYLWLTITRNDGRTRSCEQDTQAQYTPPTPTRRNCRVSSRRRRRCVHEFATISRRHNDVIVQKVINIYQNWCNQTLWSLFGQFQNCRPNPSAVVTNCVHTADATRLDSFVSSASAVCIGLQTRWQLTDSHQTTHQTHVRVMLTLGE